MQKDKYSVGFWDYKTSNQFDGKIPDVGPTICLWHTRTGQPTSRHDGGPLVLPHQHTASLGQGHQELNSPPPTNQRLRLRGEVLTDWPDCGGGVIVEASHLRKLELKLEMKKM